MSDNWEKNSTDRLKLLVDCGTTFTHKDFKWSLKRVRNLDLSYPLSKALSILDYEGAPIIGSGFENFFPSLPSSWSYYRLAAIDNSKNLPRFISDPVRSEAYRRTRSNLNACVVLIAAENESRPDLRDELLALSNAALTFPPATPTP